METMGGRIRYWRIKNKLSQRDLASLTNLTPDTIANCENNKYPKSIDTINLICEVLNLVPSSIYDDYLKFISGDVPVQIKTIRESLGLNRHQFMSFMKTDSVYSWETGKKKPSRKFYEILKKYIKK